MASKGIPPPPPYPTSPHPTCSAACSQCCPLPCASHKHADNLMDVDSHDQAHNLMAADVLAVHYLGAGLGFCCCFLLWFFFFVVFFLGGGLGGREAGTTLLAPKGFSAVHGCIYMPDMHCIPFHNYGTVPLLV